MGEKGLEQNVSEANEEDSFLNEEEDIKHEKGWLSRHVLIFFVLNFSFLQFAQMSSMVYFIGVVRTIEKRFGLNSKQTNSVMSVADIVHICLVIFVGYWGRKGHKPIMIAATSMCLVIGSLLMSSPYFIYGEETPAILRSNATNTKTAMQYCNTNQNETNKCDSEQNEEIEYINTKVVYIFLTASVFNGIGGVAMQVLGMAYIDENADKNKSALYLGIATSSFALGPIGGMFLAAFATLFPENLQTTDKSPADPTWIGAWWLGYVLCAIVLFVAAMPVFFYPKHIIDPEKRPSKVKMKYDPDQTLLQQAKEFPKAMLKLLSNKPYLCMLVTGVAGVYVIMGVFINIPRYLEIAFLQPAFKANIGAALPGIAGVFGGFIGGAVMTKLKFGPIQSAKMVVFAMGVTLAGLVVIMFIKCPEVNLAGDWDASHDSVSVQTSCNFNCSCTTTKNTYSPVCSTVNDLTYFSPCHAGCTGSHMNNQTTIFTDCACTDSSIASPGQCQEPCDTKFYMFAATMFVLSFLSSLGRVPGTVVQFRIVDEDEGSFALGVTSFVINLLGFIPGPIMFGAIIDSTCVLWQTTCGQRGACLFYDTNAFRLLTYGVSSTFQLIAFCLSLLLVYAISKMEFKKPAVEMELNGNIQDSQKELVMDKVSGI